MQTGIKTIFGRFSPWEKRVLLICILAAIIFSVGPFLIGETQTAPGYEHTSALDEKGIDTFAFYSYIQQVKTGHWLGKNLFTAEPQIATQINPVWWLAGGLARLPFISTPWAFELLRALGAVILVLVIWLFITEFIPRPRWRSIALVLTLFGSGGIGGIIYLVTNHQLSATSIVAFNAVDVWFKDGFPFGILLSSPNNMASLICLLLVIYFFKKGERTPGFFWISGLLTGLLALIHTYTALIVYLLALVLFLISLFLKTNYRETGRQIVYFLVPSLPLLLYQIGAFWAVPSLYGWWQQNILLSPPPGYYLAGCLAIFPFTIWGILEIIRRKLWSTKLLLIWLFLLPVLFYLPVTFQRKLAEGFYVPIVLVAVIGLSYLVPVWAKQWSAWSKLKKFDVIALGLIWALLVFFSTGVDVTELAQAHLTSLHAPYQVSRELISACAWLADNTPEDSVVLSAFENGSLIPAFSGRPVYLGHDHQTINFPTKTEKTRSFFQDGLPDSERQSFLHENNIKYIFYAAAEKNSSANFDPSQSTFLKPAFNNDLVTIYQII